MLEHIEENVLVSDSLPVRALMSVTGLRRRGIEARCVDRASWGTREATLFVISFDVIGRERVRVLRERFPNTPIVTISDDSYDEALALESGADAHLGADVDELATYILQRRSTQSAEFTSAEFTSPARHMQSLFRDLRSGDRGHLAASF